MTQGPVHAHAVVVVGGGGLGRQVIRAIEAGGVHSVAAVLDRVTTPDAAVAGYPVLGRDDELREVAARTGADAFVVAVGDNTSRARLWERLRGECPTLTPVAIVHPQAFAESDAVVGGGSILLAGALVGAGCRLGSGVLVGQHASLDHDCTVGDHASLAPGVTTGGAVRVGRRVALGVGANVVHGVGVGDDTVVGAGALVLGDLPDRVVAYGSPARVVRTREPGERYL